MKANKKEEIKDKKIKTITIVYAAIAMVFAYIFLIAVLIYGFGMDNPITQKTARIIPYPAAVFNWNIITVDDLDKKIVSVRRFYENQDFSALGMRVDFSTKDGQKRLKVKEKNILNKMIENQIIENEAKKRGIILTDELIGQEVDRKMKEYGSENYLKENMARLYGWTIDDFKKNIVKPDMYQEKLLDNIRQNDSSFRLAKDKIAKAQGELNSKKDFSEVAKKYSEGESAKNGGSLGWFSADQMLPEIAREAASLDKGKTSGIIESALGYHIVRMEDRKNEEGKDMFKLSQIFVRTKTLGEWLADREKNIEIFIPLKDYYWNKDNLDVEFRNKDLKNFEDNLPKNSPDDASMLF
jgi:foldase protein PrsA